MFNLLTAFLQFPFLSIPTEKAKISWLVQLRWLALALFFIFLLPFYYFGLVESHNLIYYLAIVSILAIFNLWIVFKYLRHSDKVSPLFICFHLTIDAVVLAILISFAGGAENPFLSLFFLNAALGGFLIQSRLAWPFLLVMLILLAGVQWFTVVKSDFVLSFQQWFFMGSQHFLLMGFWVVMRSLGFYLERQNQIYSQSKLQLEKQDRLRSIGALAAGFSHEFASPLFAAQLSLERLSQTVQNEDLTEALLSIQSCQVIIQQMNSSQMDIRDFKFKRVSIKNLLQDIVDSWHDLNTNVNVNFKVLGSLQNQDIKTQLPVINFAQVVLNLLDNAKDSIVAAQKAHLPIQLTLQKNKNDHFELIICDAGLGFSDSILQRFGEPFITTKQDGTGLGLYVSQLFVQSLGGEIGLKNLQNQGACVTLCWPEPKVEKENS